MKKSRFTESQIIAVLKEADAGMKISDVCRQHGISSSTYYNWKSKYGGMEVSGMKRMRELEEENAKLKRLFADVSLENQAMKDLFAKKGLVTAEKKACAEGLVARGVSVVRACLATGLSRSGYYGPEKDWRTVDAAVINAINEVLKESPHVGFWKCFGRLRFNKYRFNHKKTYRVYCRLGLSLRRRVKQVLPKHTP